MKFIINENKLEKVISTYLDGENFIINDDNKKFHSYIFFLKSPDDDYAKMSVYVRNAFGDIRNWLFIDGDYIDDMCKFFSLNKETIISLIGHWVEKTLDISLGEIKSATDTSSMHRLDVTSRLF